MNINCIAIDDEPLALLQMKNFIGKIGFLNLIATFDNAIEPLSFLKSNPIDLVFLDIEMDYFTGIQMLESLTEKPKVILTTAYESYALKGYELEVSDYLLKPISFDRFVKAVNKVYQEIKLLKHEPSIIEPSETNQSIKETYTFLKSGSKMVKIFFEDLLYVEGLKEYLLFHTKTARIISRMTFKEAEAMLPTEHFIRVHKSYIIALNKIQSIERNIIKIADKSIPLSETYKTTFLERL